MKTMKFLLLGSVLTLCSFTMIKTSISWQKTEILLGEIPQNKPAKIEFEFKNTGESPVFISNVQAGCGCTSVEFSRMPVKPGDLSKISAVYNATTSGSFRKTITVTSNAEETPRILSFSGTVIEENKKSTGTIN